MVCGHRVSGRRRNYTCLYFAAGDVSAGQQHRQHGGSGSARDLDDHVRAAASRTCRREAFHRSLKHSARDSLPRVMTPAARLQAAIEILDALDQTGKPADRFLRDWFRARRYAGSKDRAAIGERVFAIARRRASLAWQMRSESPRALVIGSLAAEGID